MLRDRRLLQPQRDHDLPHLALVPRQVLQNLAPPWLGHRVERIRSSCRPRHGLNNIFLYGYMSSRPFFVLGWVVYLLFCFSVRLLWIGVECDRRSSVVDDHSRVIGIASLYT